jgi:hypothetical protein
MAHALGPRLMGLWLLFPDGEYLTDSVYRGSCHNWLYGPGGSMGPDKGLTCTIYSAFNCPTAANQHHLDYFQFPGIPDYQKNTWLGQGDIGDGPASYKCKKL